jgi:thiol-disulfide isomerase/thioredoxin
MENLKERFNQGQSFQEYLTAVKENKSLWENNYRQFEVPPQTKKILSGIKQKFYVLAITEDWCGDSVRNLPVIAKLVETLPDSELRVIKRDLNMDLMERYALNGIKKIPTVVFLDENFKEMAVWIEKPGNAGQLQERFKNDPDGKERYLEALKEGVTKEVLEMLSTLTMGR